MNLTDFNWIIGSGPGSAGAGVKNRLAWKTSPRYRLFVILQGLSLLAFFVLIYEGAPLWITLLSLVALIGFGIAAAFARYNIPVAYTGRNTLADSGYYNRKRMGLIFILAVVTLVVVCVYIYLK